MMTIIRQGHVIEHGADLHGADLHGADLCKVNLSGADLRWANLYKANLREANLHGANLYKANLHGANLYKANLREANLREANLHGANLRTVNLREANLHGANLYGAEIVDAGQDRRGYRFVAVMHPDGLRMAVGCRWFTLSQARDHWGRPDSTSANAGECLAKVEMIATEARCRNWPEPEGGW